MQTLALCIERELKRVKAGADVRFIAERLTLGHAATAPIVVLGAEDGVGDLVRADLGLSRERLFTLVTLKTSLESVTFMLLDQNAPICHQIRVQETLIEVFVSLTLRQPTRLERAIQVTLVIDALQVPNLLLQCGAWRSFGVATFYSDITHVHVLWERHIRHFLAFRLEQVLVLKPLGHSHKLKTIKGSKVAASLARASNQQASNHHF